MEGQMELLRRFCDAIWEYDTEKNEVCIYQDTENGETGKWNQYDEVYMVYLEEYVHGEDRSIWKNHMSPEKLKQFYESKVQEDHFFVRTEHDNTGMQWHEAYIEKDENSGKLLIGTRDIKAKERKRLKFLENLPVAVCSNEVLLDENKKPYDFTYTYCNPEHEKLEGVQRGELLGRGFYEFFDDTDPKWLKYYYETAWLGIPHKIRRYSPEIGKDLLIYMTNSEPGHCDCVLLDVTKETFLMRELQRSREEMQRILESTMELTFQYDPEKRRVTIHKFGREKEDVVYQEKALGKMLTDGGLLKKKDEEMLLDCFSRICMGEHYLTAALQGRFRKEDPWIWYKLTMFDYLDENTKERKVLGYLQDINKDVFRQEELRRAAQTDALTGIWNVGGGKERVQKILASQKNEEQAWNAMFLMDIDNFKTVNDTMGHLVGDETLKRLAQILKNSFSEEDIVFRLGGDEFAAFIRNMENPDEKVAQIMRRMKHEIEASRKEYPFLGISTGIYVTNIPNAYEHYYAEADRALYQTKKQGKGHATVVKETKQGSIL